MVDMSAPPQKITTDMAVQLALEELQRQRQAMLPVDRVKKTFILGQEGGRWVMMSVDDLIGALQMRKTIAVKWAVTYVQQLRGPKDSQLYIVQ